MPEQISGEQLFDSPRSYIVNVPFNSAFRGANSCVCRYRIIYGGAGSGKSYNMAQDYIAKLSDMRYQGANLMVIRKSERANRSSTFAELCSAARRIFGEHFSEVWRVTSEPMSLECLVTGSKIIFRGMNDSSQREKIKSVTFESGKLTWIWCEEATELTREDFELLDDRLRGDLSVAGDNLYYQITATFNPVSADHWLKKRFFDCPADPSVYISHSVFFQNSFIDGDYSKRMEKRRLTDPDGYRVYALGEWGTRCGLILTNWESEALTDNPDAYDFCLLSQDFGYNHADCILLCGFRDGCIYVVRELYEKERDTAELIALAASGGFPRSLPMYCDSAEPDRIKMWKKAGYKAYPVKKEPGSVAAQIDFLKQRRIIIDPSCVNTLDEISNWRWRLDEATGEYTDSPECVHDDAMAALRYATEPLRRASTPDKPARVSKKLLGI